MTEAKSMAEEVLGDNPTLPSASHAEAAVVKFEGRPHPTHLPLANGWTFSIAEGFSGAGYTAAAWPSDDPEFMNASDRRWFQFQSGGAFEKYVYNIEDLRAAMREVAAASPPAPYKPQPAANAKAEPSR